MLTALSSLCPRNPDTGNSKVLATLTESQQQQLDSIVELAEVYSHNACTPDIHNYLVGRVQALGLFGMLRECTVPLMHNGYKLGPFQVGADLEKISMSPADAGAYHQQLLASIESCNQAIYGELPSSSIPPLLLQSVVDLMCCNWDRVKLLQSAPAGQQAAAGVRSAAEAVATALQAAAAVAAATARGDTAAADAAAAEAAAAAAIAQQQAQQLAAAEDQEVLLPEELPEPPELPLLPAASGEQPAAAQGHRAGVLAQQQLGWEGQAAGYGSQGGRQGVHAHHAGHAHGAQGAQPGAEAASAPQGGAGLRERRQQKQLMGSPGGHYAEQRSPAALGRAPAAHPRAREHHGGAPWVPGALWGCPGLRSHRICPR